MYNELGWVVLLDNTYVVVIEVGLDTTTPMKLAAVRAFWTEAPLLAMAAAAAVVVWEVPEVGMVTEGTDTPVPVL